MCIIACKASGIEMPDEKTINTMWYGNPDGAGMMYTHQNKVVIEKGFMKLKAFKQRLNGLKREIDIKNESVVLHFRIKTHGAINPSNCHPFPITDSITALQKPKVYTDIGVAHNGVINIKPRSDISDTMEYIASQLAPLKRAIPKFYADRDLMTLIANAIQSKMVFLTPDRKIHYIGQFNESDGIQYSNYGYMPYMTYRTCAYSLDDEYDYYYGNSYTDKNLNWIDEDKGYVIDSTGQLTEAYDYLIDDSGNVYKYDWKSNLAHKVYGCKVYTHSGNKRYEFNPDVAECFCVHESGLELMK